MNRGEKSHRPSYYFERNPLLVFRGRRKRRWKGRTQEWGLGVCSVLWRHRAPGMWGFQKNLVRGSSAYLGVWNLPLELLDWPKWLESPSPSLLTLEVTTPEWVGPLMALGLAQLVCPSWRSINTLDSGQCSTVPPETGKQWVGSRNDLRHHQKVCIIPRTDETFLRGFRGPAQLP